MSVDTVTAATPGQTEPDQTLPGEGADAAGREEFPGFGGIALPAGFELIAQDEALGPDVLQGLADVETRLGEALRYTDALADTAARVLDSFVPAIPDRTDVVWIDQFDDNRAGSRTILRVAPLSVAGLLRTRLFGHNTSVLTSATLTIGGSFDAMNRKSRQQSQAMSRLLDRTGDQDGGDPHRALDGRARPWRR